MERVVWNLTEEQVARGHDVTLIASGDSLTSARLVPIVDRAFWHDRSYPGDSAPSWTIALGKLASRLDEFDVVHNQLNYLADPFSRVAPW
jgi:hypothetical protein